MVKDNTHHLFLRANTWMIRIQVPKDLQAHYGKWEIVLSTKRKAHQLEEATLIRDQELAAFKVNRHILRKGAEEEKYLLQVELLKNEVYLLQGQLSAANKRIAELIKDKGRNDRIVNRYINKFLSASK